jgi:phosphomannomutase
MSEENSKMSELVREMESAYPCSGEINSTVTDSVSKIKSITERYSDGKENKLDGISVEYPEWRFNVRSSNTEPLIRLNVESRKDKILLKEKTEELLQLIRS